MADVTRVTITMQDRYNQTSRAVFHFPGSLTGPTDAIVTSLVGLLNTCLAAKAVRIEISKVEAIGGTLVAGSYSTVEDKGVLTLVDESSQDHSWRIPGIKSALVSATDHKTIDNTGLVLAWYNAVRLNSVGSGGDTFVSFARGYRSINRKITKG